MGARTNKPVLQVKCFKQSLELQTGPFSVNPGATQFPQTHTSTIYSDMSAPVLKPCCILLPRINCLHSSLDTVATTLNFITFHFIEF